MSTSSALVQLDPSMADTRSESECRYPASQQLGAFMTLVDGLAGTRDYTSCPSQLREGIPILTGLNEPGKMP
jgi:hypothetical protein